MTPKCMLKRKATSDLADTAHSGAAPGPDSTTSIPQQHQDPPPSSMEQGVSEQPPGQQQQQPRPQHGAHSLARLHRGSNEDTFLSCALPVARHHLLAAAEGAAPGGAAAAPIALPPMHLLAVFDGHSSASVSTMAAAELPQLLTQLLQEAVGSAGQAAGDDVDAVMQQVLQTAFQQLDDRIQPLDNAGTTATVAVLTPQQIHLAWVGDSRAVLLGHNGLVLAQTQEHRATREDEQERVVAAGGTILNNSGLRVMGILQCTRAIGDKDLQPYGVIATPDVHSIARTGQEEFLVLATDGLWDVMSNEEVYDFAVRTGKKVADRTAQQQPSISGTCVGCKTAGVTARMLAQVARKQRGSRDDITVMMVNLRGACSCTSPPVVLSSGTVNSSGGLLASSSTGGATSARQQPGPSVASGVQLHSSPAALGQHPAGSGDIGAALNQPQLQPLNHQLDQQQLFAAQALKQPAQQQQHQPLASLPAAHRRHPQQQQHKWQPGHGGLLLQPSVCPGSAADMQAAATHHHHHHHDAAGVPHAADGAHPSLLSDLALSSPFAMMLGGAVAEVEVVEVSDFSTASGGSSVVSGGSAPVAFVAKLSTAGSSGMRKRSLSVALGNSRSCGSTPQLVGPLGSNDQPVVVLT